MSTEQTLSFDFKSHPISIGQHVIILRLGLVVGPIVEGRAIIRSIGKQPDQYWVAFPGDPVLRLRYVFVPFQSAAVIEMLATLWRTGPALILEESFANDNTAKGRV